MSAAASLVHCREVARRAARELYVCSGALSAHRPALWALLALDAELFRARTAVRAGRCGAADALRARRARTLFWLDTLADWTRGRDAGNPVVDAVKVCASVCGGVRAAADAVAAAHASHLFAEVASDRRVHGAMLAAFVQDADAAHAVGAALDAVAALRRALPLVLAGGDPGLGADVYAAPLDWASAAARAVVRDVSDAGARHLRAVPAGPLDPLLAACRVHAERFFARIARAEHNLLEAQPHARADVFLPVRIAGLVLRRRVAALCARPSVSL